MKSNIKTARERLSGRAALAAGVVGVVVLGWAAWGWGQESEVAREQTASRQDSLREQMEARRETVEALKRRLEQAQSGEEKRAVLEAWRRQNPGPGAGRESAPSKSPRQALEELKTRAAGNEEMLQRVRQMEQRLAGVEKLRAKLEQIQQAEGEDKQQLLEELRREREEQLQAREGERAPLQQALERGEALKALPPEMAALREKAEQRKQEIEAFKAALEQAAPQARMRLLEEWRARQQAETVRRRQERENQTQGRDGSMQPSVESGK